MLILKNPLLSCTCMLVLETDSVFLLIAHPLACVFRIHLFFQMLKVN